MQKPAKEKKFFDAPKAAKFVGVSVRHFRRLSEENNIPTHEIGRLFFWMRWDLERLKAMHVPGVRWRRRRSEA